jgi:CubicO group peptidase (beta-lactamase class C family)
MTALIRRNAARISVALALVGCANPQPVIAPPQALSDRTGSFAARLNREMPGLLERAKVPGASIAIVENGSVVWANAYGVANVERRTPMTTETVFQVASISKSVAAWGVMRLVDEGRVGLDSAVDRYLTKWHVPPSSFDAKGVTIRRLLSHTAGLSVSGYPGIDPDSGALPSTDASLRGAPNGRQVVSLIAEPGTKYQYAGGGYTVLQLMVEEMSKRPFADYMQRTVLDPLGMKRSSYEWLPDLRPATATAYAADGRALPNYVWAEKAAAGLYTTPSNLGRFVAAGMEGPRGTVVGRGIILPETVKLMQTPAPNSQSPGGWYGLGYGVDTLTTGERLVGHTGSNRGWRSRFAAIPDRRAGIVVLTNSDAGGQVITPVVCWWLSDAIGATTAGCNR